MENTLKKLETLSDIIWDIKELQKACITTVEDANNYLEIAPELTKQLLKQNDIAAQLIAVYKNQFNLIVKDLAI
jgi:hypothetical protein